MILINLLNSFSGKELRHFKDFISSKYFNTDQYVVRLYSFLEKKILLQKITESPLQEKIYAYVFQEYVAILNTKQKSRLNTKISALTSLAKRFLIIESLQEDSVSKRKLLQKALLQKEQYKMVESQLKKDQQKVQQYAYKSGAYYEDMLQVELASFYYLQQRGLLLKNDNLEVCIHLLDMQYLLKKLKLHSTALSLERISKKKNYDLSKMMPIEPLVLSGNYHKDNLVQLYLLIIELMQTDKEEKYIQLLARLEQSQTEIPQAYLKDFYIASGNFCIHKIIKGELEYNQHLYQLYKRMDNKNLLTEKGKISATRLRNIVGLSCRQADFDWAKTLTHKYHSLVQDGDIRTALNFNLGVIAFYQKHYKEAIQHFIRIDNSDINCRILILKSYYELDSEYDERTMTIFRTTEQFVKNNKTLNTAHKRGYRNFIRILINLYRLRHYTGKSNKESILKKLEQMNFVSDKKWLLEKLAQV